MISHELKVIFIHTPRTGGTSVEIGLIGKNWWEVEPATKHLTCAQAKELYSIYWDDYLKIAIVRNPWDWMVSLYSSHHSARSGHGKISWQNFVLNPRLVAHEQNTIIQSEIIGEEMDFILRFENLAEDFQTLCAKLGVKRELPYFDAKSGRLGEQYQHYSNHYNEELRDLVAYKHVIDINRFDYVFETQNSSN